MRDARLIDLAPTILAWLGLPVPAQMDGRILSEAFRDLTAFTALAAGETGAAPLPERQAVYTDEERAEIERHLSDLGYL